MTQVPSTFIRSQWLHRIASAAAVAALASCGGGGGSEPAGGGGGGGGSTALSLTGTAARGAAIAGGTVEVKCATGTGTATSAANGTYTVSVTGGVLPCALRITATDGSVLYSVASGTGSSAVANLSPVTQLVVAALTGADPATVYTNFSSTTAGAVTASKVTAAVTSVVATLKSAGIDLTTVGDVMSASLVVGNTYDQALDALKAALTSSGTTLAQLTQTVANMTTTTAPATTSATPSLPADLLLRPAASNCAALRSGVYRGVAPQVAAAGSFATALITVNAATLSITNGTSTWSWTPNGPCRFAGATGEDIVVSQAGVIVSRDHGSAGDPFHLAVGFPEQTHTVAELEGAWNSLGFERNDAGTAYAAGAATVTLNSSGVSTAISFCANVKSCVPVTTETVTLSVNSGGGFTRTFASGVSSDRVFAYRAGGGELMLLDIAGNGSFGMATRQRTNALPVVGTATNFWSVDINTQLVSTSALSVGGNTIKTVDAATGAFTRDNITSGTTTRPESLVANSPRAGYTFRNAQTGIINSVGATVNVPESVSLLMRGMGVVPVELPTIVGHEFGISVVQP